MDNAISTQTEDVWPSDPEDEKLFPVKEEDGRNDLLVLGNMRHLTPWYPPFVHSLSKPWQQTRQRSSDSQWLSHYNLGSRVTVPISLRDLGGRGLTVRIRESLSIIVS